MLTKNVKKVVKTQYSSGKLSLTDTISRFFFENQVLKMSTKNVKKVVKTQYSIAKLGLTDTISRFFFSKYGPQNVNEKCKKKSSKRNIL